MMPAMDEVGRRFECEEYFVPELLLSARAMKGSLETAPSAAGGARRRAGGPRGDRHREGRPARYRQEPGGVDARRRRLRGDRPGRGRGAARNSSRRCRSASANLVCLSALLTVTMPSMRTTIEALRERRRARSGEGDGGRRAGHAAVRRGDRRRRLRRERGGGGGAGAVSAGQVGQSEFA